MDWTLHLQKLNIILLQFVISEIATLVITNKSLANATLDIGEASHAI